MYVGIFKSKNLSWLSNYENSYHFEICITINYLINLFQNQIRKCKIFFLRLLLLIKDSVISLFILFLFLFCICLAMAYGGLGGDAFLPAIFAVISGGAYLESWIALQNLRKSPDEYLKTLAATARYAYWQVSGGVRTRFRTYSMVGAWIIIAVIQACVSFDTSPHGRTSYKIHFQLWILTWLTLAISMAGTTSCRLVRRSFWTCAKEVPIVQHRSHFQAWAYLAHK